MKVLQWAWISQDDADPELFPSYRTAVNAMGKRIGDENESEAELLLRAHGLGFRLALVEVTLVVKLVMDAPR